MSAPAVALGAIVGSLFTGAAWAQPAPPPAPSARDADPAAQRAAEANLETLEKRRGFTGGVSIGPSITLGQGTGNGGSLSLRLGRVATPDTVITFQLDASAQLHRTGTGEMASTYTNSVASFLVGGQFWIGPSLWVRAAGGFGVYTCTKLCGNGALPGDTDRRPGLAGAVGVGVDVARFKGLVLAVELSSINQLNRNGMLSTNAFALALSFD